MGFIMNLHTHIRCILVIFTTISLSCPAFTLTDFPCIFCCAVLRCIVLYFFGSPASLIRVAYKNMGEELVKEAWETNQFLHKRKEISFPLPGTINCLYIFGERQGLRKPSPTFFPFQILRHGLNKLLGLDSVSLYSPASAS